MKPFPDSIHIVTSDFTQGEQLKSSLGLRGFDKIRCLTLQHASSSLSTELPVLLVVDLGAEHTAQNLETLLKPVAGKVKILVLANSFDDNLFLLCHDFGTRDYLIKPVPEAYLVSRVINLLQEARFEQILRQKDEILVETGVLSERSGCFTTSYLMKQLERQMLQHTLRGGEETMSLVLVALDGGSDSWRVSDWNAVYAEVASILKSSSRGLDTVGEYLVDKFAVILPNTPKKGAAALANRLEDRFKTLAERWRLKTRAQLTVRIGLAEATNCKHYEDLLNQARATLNR
jgi:diguanylate cyclase (GGDEF)-like protein